MTLFNPNKISFFRGI